MSDLIFHNLGWSTLGVAVLLFGFAPGVALRLIVLLYSRENLRRRELIGELYAVPRLERPFWVAEQLEVALFEGLRPRIKARQIASFVIWLIPGWLLVSFQTLVEFLLRSQLGWSHTEANITTWALTVILALVVSFHFIGRGFHNELTSEMRRLLLTEVAVPPEIPVVPDNLSHPPTSTVHAGWLILKARILSPYREDAHARAGMILNDVLGEADGRSERAELLLEHMNGNCFECSPLADCWICNPIKAAMSKVNAGRRD